MMVAGQGEQQSRDRRARKWVLGIIGVAGVLAFLIGLGLIVQFDRDETEHAAARPTATATAPPSARPAAIAPPYDLQQADRQFTALVRTDDTDELIAVFREIAQNILARNYVDGGYFVNVDCAIGDDPAKEANRLGRGKIARGDRGAAETGLNPGQYTIDFNAGRTCREGAPTTTFDATRPLDRDYAVELCLSRIEEKYVADQRPVTLSDVDVISADGTWTVTAVARGTSKPGAPSMADVDVSCVSQSDPLRTELTKFNVR
ncbi:hypothetical protein ACQP1O_18885 [Nocardia sp. CA-151230]|uniref:hypothetical protein n=1 Tax=Nocardia sp. CA-151230 TaxID=3239982 RepID=UPI003D9091AD